MIEEKATNYEQKDWVDRMIWKAKTIYKADWIINADADELWYASTGNLKDELYATNANVLNCEMRSVYPEEEKPFWQWDKTVKAVTEPENMTCHSIRCLSVRTKSHSPDCRLPANFNGKP